jgi:hypothetical protein
VEGLGTGGVVGWVEVHGRLKAVEAARQGRAGQLDREWFVYADGSLHGAQRPTMIVAELVPSCDIGGEVEGRWRLPLLSA